MWIVRTFDGPFLEPREPTNQQINFPLGPSADTAPIFGIFTAMQVIKRIGIQVADNIWTALFQVQKEGDHSGCTAGPANKPDEESEGLLAAVHEPEIVHMGQDKPVWKRHKGEGQLPDVSS